MPKILAIDDNQDNLTSLSALLKIMIPGCEVITATSGPEGIKKARTHLPDTILLDIRMPVMDGYEVCQHLKNDNYVNHIPVIMISAILTGSKDQVKGFDCGADAYLAKPIDEYVLAAQVTTALRIKKAEDMLRRQKNQLEEIVQERTAELVKTNRQLQQKIEESLEAQKKAMALESQLRQAQKMESVGRLAGGVAHDYNNSLSVIMGYTEMAMMDMDPAENVYDTLAEVLTAAKRAAGITRQLLAFARKQTISPMVLDLNASIEAMLKMLSRLIGEDKNLAWLPGTNLWPVKMDPSQVDQILANLCVNARDAIEGVGNITIETGTVILDNDCFTDNADFVSGAFVLLSVKDNGCGMDQTILDNIFEPFFTTKDVNKGTGLGLSTVYGIVKQNNGFINVDSEPGKGTTIKIYLPRHTASAVDPIEKDPGDVPKGQGETILLVEDDLAILNLVRQTLTGLGYTVLTAETPRAALDLAQKTTDSIHLLITDVILPEMNGRTLSNALKSIYADIKCLYMSGYTSNVIAHHGVLDKDMHFLQKPFSTNTLANAIRKALK